MTEGASDITYLQCAIRALHTHFPLLTTNKDGRVIHQINFLKPSGISRDILNLGHGSSGQGSLLLRYSSLPKEYWHKPLLHPVIILYDNDAALTSALKPAKHLKKTISTSTTEAFNHIEQNLYLVKVPESSLPQNRDIESLFPQALLNTNLNGEAFNSKKPHGDNTQYGENSIRRICCAPTRK